MNESAVAITMSPRRASSGPSLVPARPSSVALGDGLGVGATILVSLTDGAAAGDAAAVTVLRGDGRACGDCVCAGGGEETAPTAAYASTRL